MTKEYKKKVQDTTVLFLCLSDPAADKRVYFSHLGKIYHLYPLKLQRGLLVLSSVKGFPHTLTMPPGKPLALVC
jgi:hypothetical protein